MDSKELIRLMDRACDGKQEFLDYLEYVDVHIEDEDVYEEIISWPDDKVVGFANWWDWDLDELRDAVFLFNSNYINNKGHCA